MKNIKEVSLLVALFVGVLVSDFSNILGFIGFIGLIAGFINVYFTTKRSELFIVPDMVWVACSIISLIATRNYTDMVLYIFYIYIGFVQYLNWKINKVDNKVQIEYNLKLSYFNILLIIIILELVFGKLVNSQNNFIGSLATAFGITGAYLLSQREYYSEYFFVVSNLCSIYVLYTAGLHSLAIIPTTFLWFSMIFLFENRRNNV